MADFYQYGGTDGGHWAGNFTARLSVWENWYDIGGNFSNVSYRLELISGSSGRFSDYSGDYTISINGIIVKTGSGRYSSQSYNTAQIIAEGDINIYHNEDGTKNIGCWASLNFQSGYYSPGNFSPSGYMDLSRIPRTTTVWNSIRNVSLNEVSINWSTANPIDYTQYSINDSEWIDARDNFVDSENKNGYYVVPRLPNGEKLQPNTTYKIRTRCKRTDSQMWSDSVETLYPRTYDIARITSAPTVNIGDKHTISWNNESGQQTSLKLETLDGKLIEDYGIVTGLSKEITPPAKKLYELSFDTNTYIAKYTITTTYIDLKGEVNIYSSSTNVTFNVTNSNPTFTNFDYEDTNDTTYDLTGSRNILINGYSKIKGIITEANKAIGKNNATLGEKAYKLVLSNGTYYGDYKKTGKVEISSTNVIQNANIDMFATDSRGNSTKVTKTANFKNYFDIIITSMTATRENNIGTEVNLKFEVNFWNESFGKIDNDITECIYKYKQTSQQEYTTGTTAITYVKEGNKITGNLKIAGDLGAEGFNASNSYNIQLQIKDKLSTSTYTVTFGSGNPALAISKNNVAIGQKYDENEGSKLQVNGSINIKSGESLKFGGINTVRRNPTNDTIISSTSTSGGMFFRPRGDYETTEQTLLSYNGNLTIHNGLPVYSSETLYNNEQGSNGTITLSKSIDNFDYIEVFFKDNTNTMIKSIKKPKTNINFWLPLSFTTFYISNNVNYTDIRMRGIQISGTSLYNVANSYGYINFPGSNPASQWNDNYIYVIKVIGYR